MFFGLFFKLCIWLKPFVITKKLLSFTFIDLVFWLSNGLDINFWYFWAVLDWKAFQSLLSFLGVAFSKRKFFKRLMIKTTIIFSIDFRKKNLEQILLGVRWYIYILIHCEFSEYCRYLNVTSSNTSHLEAHSFLN